jgi:transposase
VNETGKVEIKRKFSRSFVKKGKKNDATDAAAICEAASRPDVKFVPTKNVEQLGILALHAARSLLVKQQTMRGLATEFGITVPKGIQKLDELMTLVNADEGVPKQTKQTITGQVQPAPSPEQLGSCNLDPSFVT